MKNFIGKLFYRAKIFDEKYIKSPHRTSLCVLRHGSKGWKRAGGLKWSFAKKHISYSTHWRVACFIQKMKCRQIIFSGSYRYTVAKPSTFYNKSDEKTKAKNLLTVMTIWSTIYATAPKMLKQQPHYLFIFIRTCCNWHRSRGELKSVIPSMSELEWSLIKCLPVWVKLQGPYKWGCISMLKCGCTFVWYISLAL